MTRGKRGGAKEPSQRQLRMGELIRHILSDVLARGAFRDPVLAEARVTVTEVRPSPDLKNATVFVTPLGGEDMAAVVAALQRARSYLRGQIAQSLETRSVPELSFKPDLSFAHAERIDSLLAKGNQ
jgi:ribosome-binding factor A